MNGGERFNAVKVNKYLQESVQEKTVLLIEAYDGRMRGNVLALLQHLLEDVRFADWKFRWTALNADGVETDLTGTQRDPRIELVRGGALGFIAAMETSQVVLSGMRLPRWYIKRPGQLVAGLFPDSFYQRDDRITKARAFMQQTLGKLDFLCIESDAAKEAVNRWYPNGMPFRLLEGAPLRHMLRRQVPDDVVLSLSEKALGKLYSDVEQRFKSVRLICAEHDKTLFMRIPHKRWMSYQEENAPEVLDHVGDDTLPICQALHGAEVLVTDRLDDVQESIKLSVPCVFFSNRVGEFYELYQENRDRLVFAGDWDEVCDRLREFQMRGVAASHGPEIRDAAASAVAELVNGILEAREDPQKAAKPERRSELFVLLSTWDKGALSALKYYKPDTDVSVLLTSATTPNMWGSPLDERISLNVKQGLYDGTGQIVEEIPLKAEWKRMLGGRTYDTVYAKTTTDALWKKLYYYAPAKEVVHLSREEILDLIIRNVGNPILRNLSLDDDPMELVEIDGKPYYKLGGNESEDLCLEYKGELARPSLVFINNKKERDPVLKYIAEDSTRTYFLLDPGCHMEDSEELETENVYWLPIKQLPVKLFLYAETVVQCRDYAVRSIAERMEKELTDLTELTVAPTRSARWDLLGIQSAEELLD